MRKGINISHVNMGVVTNLSRKQKLKKFEKDELSPKLLPNNKNNDNKDDQSGAEVDRARGVVPGGDGAVLVGARDIRCWWQLSSFLLFGNNF